jgi:phenylacetate-CoA ligase
MREHGIQADSVRGADDWRRLPLMTKADYLRRHSLPDLCRDGDLSACVKHRYSRPTPAASER